MCNEKFVGLFYITWQRYWPKIFRISLEKNGGCTTKEGLL